MFYTAMETGEDTSTTFALRSSAAAASTRPIKAFDLDLPLTLPTEVKLPSGRRSRMIENKDKIVTIKYQANWHRARPCCRLPPGP